MLIKYKLLFNKANCDWYEVYNKCTYRTPCVCLFSGFDSIYALVNNAGVFYKPYGPFWSEDNFDIQFQTNYLGKKYYTILHIVYVHKIA